MFEYFVCVSFFLFLNIAWHIVGIYVFETVKLSHSFCLTDVTYLLGDTCNMNKALVLHASTFIRRAS